MKAARPVRRGAVGKAFSPEKPLAGRLLYFYANSLIAGVAAGLIHGHLNGFRVSELLLLGPLALLFFFASRDTLSKYYSRVDVMLEKEKP